MFKSVLTAIALATIATPAVAQDITVVESVQHTVNSTIEYKLETGSRDFWKIPTKSGDCEDFAILKRQLLIDAGWDANDLEVTLVLSKGSNGKVVNVGHIILYVKSLDLVLDIPNNSENVPLTSANFYETEDYRFFCKIGDISEKMYQNVSDRCDRSSFRRVAKN